MLFNIEGVVVGGSIELQCHEYGTEVTLEVNNGMIAIGGRVFDIDGHLSQKGVVVGGSRSGSFGLRGRVFVLERIKLGWSSEGEGGSRHSGGGLWE